MTVGLKGALGPIKVLLVAMTVRDGTFRPAEISLDQALARLEGFERKPVLRVLDRLCRDGDLDLVGEELVDARQPGPRLRNPTWRVVRDLRLRRDHQVKSRVTCRDKVWSTLRGLRPRATTLSELTRLTGCDFKAVFNIVKTLERTGYVRCAGMIGREKAWALVKDTGPKRPETPVKEERP